LSSINIYCIFLIISQIKKPEELNDKIKKNAHAYRLCALIFAITGTTVRFPYFFLDFDKFGLWVFAFVGAMLIFFLLLSHAIYWIDQKAKKIIKSEPDY